jgi:hypothetical protein
MIDTPQTPKPPAGPPAAPAPPGAPAPRVLRLPSTRASAALAVTMLVIGVAVGAAIGPAPQTSLASGRLPLLIASLAARAQSQAAAQASAAPVQPPPVSPQATPAAEAPSTPASKQTPAHHTSSTPAPSAPSSPSPSTPAPTKPGAAKNTTLPPVTSVWLIQLSGTSFTEALAQPAAVPYIDTQLIPASTFLSGWTALEGSAFASDAALAEHADDVGGPPPILNSIVQPPCPEGAAGAACAQGTPGALSAADAFLKATVSTLTTTASFREHGLIVVTFGEVGNATATGLPVGASTVTLTSLPPAGVVLLSPFARAGARPSTPFNPTSPQQSLEKLLH